jgi:hypothetical protein
VSTSPDLVHWTTPDQFFAAPAREFTHGSPTDENVVLVTPGTESNQVIGQTGYVLYAHTDAWGWKPHTLWRRTFRFQRSGP